MDDQTNFPLHEQDDTNEFDKPSIFRSFLGYLWEWFLDILGGYYAYILLILLIMGGYQLHKYSIKKEEEEALAAQVATVYDTRDEILGILKQSYPNAQLASNNADCDVVAYGGEGFDGIRGLSMVYENVEADEILIIVYYNINDARYFAFGEAIPGNTYSNGWTFDRTGTTVYATAGLEKYAEQQSYIFSISTNTLFRVS